MRNEWSEAVVKGTEREGERERGREEQGGAVRFGSVVRRRERAREREQ